MLMKPDHVAALPGLNYSSQGHPTSMIKRLTLIGAISMAIAAMAWQLIPLIHAVSKTDSTATIQASKNISAKEMVLANLSAISGNGTPPANIVSSIYIPVGAKLVGHHNFDHSMGVFNRQVTYETPQPPGNILDFAKAVLLKKGWSIQGQYRVPNSGDTEILAKKAGSDGNYWEVSYSSHLEPVKRETMHPLTKFQIEIEQAQDES
jgi:hypothetical protein